MACYSNETKHKCAKIVIYISVVVLLLGLLTAIFGFMQSSAGKEYATEYGVSFDISGGFAVGTIIGGILCIITGVLGLLTGKFKKAIFTIPFLVMSFLIFILLVVAGGIMAGGEEAITEIVDKACAAKPQGFDQSTKELFESQLSTLVDAQMCTDVCPCDEAAEATWNSVSSSDLV